MNDARTSRAVERFLGPDAAQHGPFGLLGLTPATAIPALNEAALEEQLGRVSAHQAGDTPEADDVRLALHIAAAQLLAPEVRREMARRYQGPMIAGKMPEFVPARAALVPDRSQRRIFIAPDEPAPVSDLHAENPVRMVLAIGGVVALAVLVVLVVGLALVRTGTAPPVKPTASGASTVPPAPTQPSPASEAVSELAAKPGPPKPAPAGVQTGAPLADGRAAVRRMRDALVATGDRSAAVLSASEATGRIWCRLSVGERRAVIDGVLEYVYDADVAACRAVASGLAQAAAPIAGGGASLDEQQIWPAAWAAGVLTKLYAERDLPRAAAAPISDALIATLGAEALGAATSFDSGAALALHGVPLLIALAPGGGGGRVDAKIARWLEAERAIGGADDAAIERAVTEGLEQVMTGAPEPDVDQGVYDTISALAGAVRWRKDMPGRARLLEWFRDERVSVADLRVLTAALATRSGAEGVGPTMMLSIGAGADDRARLRGAYAKAWGFEAEGDRRTALGRLTTESRRLLAPLARTATSADELAIAAHLAILNQGARQLWLGDGGAAAATLDSSTKRVADALAAAPVIPTARPSAAPAPRRSGGPGRPGRGGGLAPSAPSPEPVGSGDGAWALAYLKAERHIQGRLDRLAQLDQVSGPLGPIDAGVLASEACQGVPSQVRGAAQKAVQRFVDDPALVESVLHQLHDAPRVAPISQMIGAMVRENLPPPTDPAWEATARRLLLSRLLAGLTAESRESAVDRLALVIAESYAKAAGIGSGLKSESGAHLAVRAASELFERMRADAAPGAALPRGGAASAAVPTLAEIERRREGRRIIAAGPIQAFAAEEVCIAELLASLVATERPAKAGAAATILADLAAERRTTDHIFRQIAACERAMTRLWLLRLGEDAV